MIKILIVDDELLVRIGLKSTLDWENHGYSLVGEARNAREAQDMFERYSPDILLTDISMPGLNGLELISRLRAVKPDLQSIILTHYEDFAYAREAVQLGALDYILKSNLTPERLLGVLARAKTQLPGRGRKPAADARQEADFSKKSSGLLAALLFDYSEEKAAAHDLYGSLSKSLPYSRYQLVSVRFNLLINDNTHQNLQQKQIIEDVSHQVLSDFPFSVIRLIRNNEIVCLFNFDSNQTVNNERIEQMMHKFEINLKKYLNFYLLIGISSPSDRLETLPPMYAQAVEAANTAFFEKDHISVYDENKLKETVKDIEVDAQKIVLLLEKGKKEELLAYMEYLFNRISLLRNLEILKSMFNQSLQAIQLFLGKADNRRHYSSLNESILEEENFSSLYDFNAVKMHVLNIFEMILSAGEKVEDQQQSYIIKQSVEYIDSHYNQNISLSNLAGNVEVSRSYLSFLFKQELGLNFSHYLTQTRIRNAKKMLTESNMKIYEIADRVGFDSPYYFSKVFKETTGMTCKDYRNRHFGNGLVH